ncbi:MAG: SdpI family protein [Acidimicrobiia bacterium]|nr:SdpI family protein [Acidimicrobiia bacterium]
MFDGAAASDPMPLGVAIGMGLLLIVTGGLLAVVARRSRRGTLPRNWIVGIRTRATLASEAAWEAAHRAAATALAIGAGGTTLAGLLVLFRPSNGVGLAIISIGLVWLLVGVMAGGYVGTRAARQESGR